MSLAVVRQIDFANQARTSKAETHIFTDGFQQRSSEASLSNDISNCNIGYRVALAETPGDQRPHKAYCSISLHLGSLHGTGDAI